METIEQLKQENEKLNARLQKAITVFGEQKANITRLTEERDAANESIEKLNSRVKELEGQALVKSQNDDKFFEQLQEIDALKEQLNTVSREKDDAYTDLKFKTDNEIKQLSATVGMHKAKCETYDKMLTEKNEEFDKLTAAYNKLNEEHTKFMNDTQTEMDAMQADFEKNSEEWDTERVQLQERLDKASKIYAENKKQIDELTAQLTDMKDQYKKLEYAHKEYVENSCGEIELLKKSLSDQKNHVEQVKETAKKIQTLGSELITNFDMFA